MTAPRAFVLFLCFFFLLFFTVILGVSDFHISFILFGVVVFISVLCGIIENVGHFYMWGVSLSVVVISMPLIVNIWLGSFIYCSFEYTVILSKISKAIILINTTFEMVRECELVSWLVNVIFVWLFYRSKESLPFRYTVINIFTDLLTMLWSRKVISFLPKLCLFSLCYFTFQITTLGNLFSIHIFKEMATLQNYLRQKMCLKILYFIA